MLTLNSWDGTSPLGAAGGPDRPEVVGGGQRGQVSEHGEMGGQEVTGCMSRA